MFRAWLTTVVVCLGFQKTFLLGEDFRILLCRLPNTDDFNFSVKNLRNGSYVSGHFIDGEPDMQFVSKNAEVTEKAEHYVSFDISERSFIVESNGTVTIDNHVSDRFYISAVTQNPFPLVILTYSGERQLMYVPYDPENTRDDTMDKNGFEIAQPDAWVEKHYGELCNNVDFGEGRRKDIEKDDKEDGSCCIF
jgi:hypothetical protein